MTHRITAARTLAALLALAPLTALAHAAVTPGIAPLSAGEHSEPDRAEADYQAGQERIMREEGMFGLVTMAMEAPQIIVMCNEVAQKFGVAASDSGDPQLRDTRESRALRFRQRLAAPMADVTAQTSAELLEGMREEANQALNLLSYAPDPAIAQQLAAGANEDDFMFLFVASIADRCDTRLDALGVP